MNSLIETVEQLAAAQSSDGIVDEIRRLYSLTECLAARTDTTVAFDRCDARACRLYIAQVVHRMLGNHSLPDSLRGQKLGVPSR